MVGQSPIGDVPGRMDDTRDLRRFLATQMTRVAAGQLDTGQVKGIVNLAQQIHNTLTVEAKIASVSAKLGADAVKPVRFDAG